MVGVYFTTDYADSLRFFLITDYSEFHRVCSEVFSVLSVVRCFSFTTDYADFHGFFLATEYAVLHGVSICVNLCYPWCICFLSPQITRIFADLPQSMKCCMEFLSVLICAIRGAFVFFHHRLPRFSRIYRRVCRVARSFYLC